MTENYPFCTIVNRKGKLYDRGELIKKEYTYTVRVETGVDENGSPIYEDVEQKGEVIVGQIWLSSKNIDAIPFLDANYSFLGSLKGTLNGWDSNQRKFNPVVVRYDPRNPVNHTEPEEMSMQSLISEIDSLINDINKNFYPNEFYPAASALKPSGKFVNLGIEHTFWYFIGSNFFRNGEFWIWNAPSRNERFIYPAKKFLEVIYTIVSDEVDAVGADDWEKLRFKVVYYSIYDLRALSEEKCGASRMWDICIQKTRQLVRELKYIYNKKHRRRDYLDKMAGGRDYHPLNEFWVTDEGKGLYKTSELQNMIFQNSLAGGRKFKPDGIPNFIDSLKQ